MSAFDLTPAYQEAKNSKYAQYVPQPVYDWRDALFGWATGSPQKKQNAWASQVKALELEDQTISRQKEALEKAGLNPYAILGSQGSVAFSGTGAQGYDDDSSSGSDVFKKMFMSTLGALLTAVTKSPAPNLILTSGSKVFDSPLTKKAETLEHISDKEIHEIVDKISSYRKFYYPKL